ncbi:MAG: hypothetical protein R3C14_25960 [Caldilineaceae bacterium]
MAPSICPYLTRTDGQGRFAAPIDYPSFENHCRALGDETMLVLADQATFCLSGSYRLCDHYLAQQWTTAAATDPRAGQPASGHIPHAYGTTGTEQAFRPDGADTPSSRSSAAGPRRATSRQQAPQSATPPSEWEEDAPTADEPHWSSRPQPSQFWTWVGAGIIFVSVFLVGGIIAAYTGWQLAQENLALARQNEVSTLPSGQAAAQPLFLVVTAVNQAPTESDAALPTPAAPVDEGSGAPAQLQQNAFPVAVTPTPVPVIVGAQPTPTNGANSDAGQAAPVVVTPQNLLLPPVEPTPVPVIDVLQPVPTRRPTPEFELPTSTAVPVEPTATATAVIVGTPVVIFSPDEQLVPPGECTKLRWHVENVRAVYYENQAALGDGVHEECIKKEADTYALTIILGDGQTHIYTATVGVLWPTATPTPTPSFTPELIPTETWTPEPPTLTPTPNVVYGVTLGIEGDAHRQCNVDSECAIGVLASNVGDSTDTIAVEIASSDSWQALLCRQDGVCSTSKLALSEIGPGNTAYIALRITVPVGVSGQHAMYQLRALSEGSGGSITSEVVTVEVVAAEAENQ